MKRAICLGFALALIGCGQAETPAPAPIEKQAPPVAATLAPLGGGPLDVSLQGELGCSFRAGEDQLLLAMGFVAAQEPSEAVVRRGDALVKLIATEPGGFDALSDGVTFEGEGVSAEVRLGAPNNEPGSEQVRHDATLITRADGAEQTYEGAWTCGP